MHSQNENSTAIGTGTGTVFTVLANIDSQDYLQTIVLAIIGAVVSFGVSLFLKWLIKQFRK